MVMAKLHIICGNCGCNDMFSFIIDPKGRDITIEEEAYLPEVFIICGNCSTLHSLTDNAILLEDK